MDSIDDDWDIDQPAAAGVAEVSPAVTSPTRAEPSTEVGVAEQTSASEQPSKWPLSAKPTASQQPAPGRFSSPLGLRSPATASKPPPTSGAAALPSDVAAAAADPKREKEGEQAPLTKPVVSKVQLAAEAFRQKSAVQTPVPSRVAETKAPTSRAVSPAVSEPGHEARAFPTVDTSQQITVSPVVEIEESLELQEITGDSNVAPEAAAPAEVREPSQPAVAVVPQPEKSPHDRITPVAILSFPDPPQAPVAPQAATRADDAVTGTAAAEFPVEPVRSDTQQQISSQIAIAQPKLEEPKLEEPKPADFTEPVLDKQASDKQAPDKQAPDKQASDKQASDKQASDHESVAPGVLAAASRKDSTKTKHLGDKHPSGRHSVGKLPLDPALSLDASYAVEFFSAAPPQAHFDAGLEHEHELDHDASRLRTAEQVARQAYLRSIVIKVMVATAIFAAVVVFTMWRRGMIRFLP